MVATGSTVTRSRLGLLLVLSGNMLLDALEVSIVVIALPSIGTDLRLSPGVVHSLMSGFALGFGGLLLPGARLVAALGRRRVYLVSLLVFAGVSVLGWRTGAAVPLIATRVVKGGCVALTAPTGLAIIAAAFPEGPARNRAVSTYSLFGACGFAVGLVASGILTGAGWRWIFLVPAPVALALFAFGVWLIPGDEPGPAAAARPAWSRVLRHRPLLRSALGAATLNGSYWGFLFIGTFHLQRHWSPLWTALALLPSSVLLALAAAFSARLVGRFGTARLIALGAAAPPLGYALFLPLRSPPDYATGVLPAVVLVGLGFVLAFAALNVQALAGFSGADQKAAGAVYQTAVQLGGAVTLAVTAGIVASGGLRPALLFIIAAGVLGLLVALTAVVQPKESSS
jgi:predicted MFS family arabinose efflux permease